MGLRIVIVLFIALPITIYGQNIPKLYADEVAVLDKYADNGTMMANNNVILVKKGFLGERVSGFFYKGQWAENKHPITIKFIQEHIDYGGLHELEIFKKLQADTNPAIEQFGIPAVYYHGEWENFIVIVMTRIDGSVDDIKETRAITPLELMILLKNFVIQSKYMHDHGVCNSFFDSDSIMVASNQSFIIDFNEAEIMKKERAPLLTHRDWKYFLCTILRLYDVKNLNTWHDLRPVLSTQILDEGLCSVIKEFGDEAFSANRSENVPNYDGLKEFIDEKIKEHQQQQQLCKTESLPIFSFLSRK